MTPGFSKLTSKCHYCLPSDLVSPEDQPVVRLHPEMRRKLPECSLRGGFWLPLIRFVSDYWEKAWGGTPDAAQLLLEAGGCPASPRSPCHHLLLSLPVTLTRPPDWADWSLAVSAMESRAPRRHFLALPRSSSPPLLACVAPLCPSTRGGRVLGVMLSWAEPGKFPRLLLPPRAGGRAGERRLGWLSRESCSRLLGFWQHRQLHAGLSGRLTRTCVLLYCLHHLAGLVPEPWARRFLADPFLPKPAAERKAPSSSVDSIFMVSACLGALAAVSWRQGLFLSLYPLGLVTFCLPFFPGCWGSLSRAGWVMKKPGGHLSGF